MFKLSAQPKVCCTLPRAIKTSCEQGRTNWHLQFDGQTIRFIFPPVKRRRQRDQSSLGIKEQFLEDTAIIDEVEASLKATMRCQKSGNMYFF